MRRKFNAETIYKVEPEDDALFTSLHVINLCLHISKNSLHVILFVLLFFFSHVSVIVKVDMDK